MRSARCCAATFVVRHRLELYLYRSHASFFLGELGERTAPFRRRFRRRFRKHGRLLRLQSVRNYRISIDPAKGCVSYIFLVCFVEASKGIAPPKCNPPDRLPHGRLSSGPAPKRGDLCISVRVGPWFEWLACHIFLLPQPVQLRYR